MRKIIILILFIFITLPCFSEEVLYLDKKWDKSASKILYEYELREQNLTPDKAYELFGYRLSDVRAVFYDLNSDGIDEVIGYIYAPYYWCRDGWSLSILQKKNSIYKDICAVNTNPWLGVYILETKTAGFFDIRVFPTINSIERIAKYNNKYKYYEYFFPN